MRFPIAIEPGNDTTAYGVIFPDLPGCFSAGDSLDEAISNSKEAASLWIEEQLDEGLKIPSPSSLEEIIKKPEFKGWVVSYVDVDLSQFSDKIQRINITLPTRVLRRLDQKAKAAGISRSGYIAQSVLRG